MSPGRRHAHRLPLRPPRRQGARRRRAGHDGDGLRLPEGRITPGCTGIWDDAQDAGLGRIADFVHAESASKIGMQLGHSGRKGSTKLMWEGMDQPLEHGNWEVISPSPLPYQPGVNQVPREMTAADLAAGEGRVRRRRRACRRRGVRPARAALRARVPALLVHLPADQRAAGRVRRQPREPAALPARGLRRHACGVAGAQAPDGAHLGHRLGRGRHRRGRRGADRPGVQGRRCRRHRRLHRPGHPRRGARLRPGYQTPFADAIRNRVGIPTIAVGIISSWDDVNSIVLAGRADLCAVGRAHLYDPSWTLHAAVEQDYDGPGAVWPMPWRAGRRKPQTGRSDGPKPRLQLVREGAAGTRHARWRPNDA